jgi:hypothetical protein
VRVKYWDHCSQSQENGLELGCISRTDRNGRQFWVVATERVDAGRFVVHDAHLDDGKRFVVRAEEKLTAFVELEATIWTHSLGRTLRINSIGDFFLKNQGLSPIGSRAASITILDSHREPQNRDFLATCSPASCKDQLKTNAAEKKKTRRF